MSYGIFESKGVWFAKVPEVAKKDGYAQKGFYPSKWKDPRAAAALWRDKTGREIWGANRWDLIATYGAMAVRRLRSPISGVAVFKATSKNKLTNVEYPVFVVSWRDYNGEKHSETFSPKRCGTLEQAEADANLYAAIKRSELTGGSLNLPAILTN